MLGTIEMNKLLRFEQKGDSSIFSVYDREHYRGYIVLETNTSFTDRPNQPPFFFRPKGDPFICLDMMLEITEKLKELSYDTRIAKRKPPMFKSYNIEEDDEVPVVEIKSDSVVWDAGEWEDIIPTQPKYVVADKLEFPNIGDPNAAL